MASTVLTWTPGGGSNVVSQDVQYRVSGATNWTTAATGLGATVSTYTITGLSVNTIYEYRVISNCSVGGPKNSPPVTNLTWYCPTVTVTPSHNTITYSFSALSGSISGYLVELMNSALDTVIQSKTTVSGVFDSPSITASTTYYVRVTLTAGTFSNVCAPVSTSTTSTPTCPEPTITSAVITSAAP